MEKLLIILVILYSSCVDYTAREKDLKNKYPQCIILPPSALIQEQGFQLMMEDTITKSIYAICYYPGSTTKISQMRIIK